VWDHIENNGFSNAVQDGLTAQYPDDLPRFLPDAAFGYCDEAVVRHDLAAGGFGADGAIEPVEATSRALCPEVPALAMCQAGPVRNEIEERDPEGLLAATAAAPSVLRARYGAVDVVAPMRTFLISARLMVAGYETLDSASDIRPIGFVY
jgi:hypothetical protein